MVALRAPAGVSVGTGQKRRASAKSHEGPILLAVDPMEKDSRRMRDVVKAIELVHETRQKIIPVSVLSPVDLSWPVELIPSMQGQLFEGASKSLTALLKRYARVGMENPKILLESRLSHRRAVEALVNFAKSEKASLIVASSHGYRGLQRARFGSFAETLVAISPVPLLIVGPKAEVRPKVKRIFFPTDFSPASRKSFLSVLDLAKRTGAEIFLYHQLGPLDPPMAYAGVNMTVDPRWLQEMWEQEQRALQRRGDQWIQIAKEKSGVRCHFLVDHNPGRLGEGITRVAQEQGADLVAMGIKQGPWSLAFFGGNLREIISEGPAPVLISRPK
jgi:nucleotide-binding universal stress UspA family protein